MGCREGPENPENRLSGGHELNPKRRQKSPNPTFDDPCSLLKNALAEKKRTRMGSRMSGVIAMTLTRREKSENEKGFRRFRRAKTPEKAFSGNYAFSARESAQVPVLQGGKSGNESRSDGDCHQTS